MQQTHQQRLVTRSRQVMSGVSPGRRGRMPRKSCKPPPEERTIIEQVRDLMPRRALSLSESYIIAEQQAYRLLDLLELRAPHVTYTKLLSLPNIEIRLEPAYRMDHFSGVSRFSHGRWLIIVDKNDVHGRRRFTLAHEFKHVIDHSLEKVAYARFGHGDDVRRQAHIEAVCQHFAACFLMPKTWMKASWANGLHDVPALAGLFQVSVSAMDVRLRRLGMLDDEPDRDVSTYFRQDKPKGCLDDRAG
jgi:Zn-dependent peptidase ImmA (M78 family)